MVVGLIDFGARVRSSIVNLAIDFGFCSGWADRPSERGCTCEKEGWGVAREEIERHRELGRDH